MNFLLDYANLGISKVINIWTFKKRHPEELVNRNILPEITQINNFFRKFQRLNDQCKKKFLDWIIESKII